MEAAGVAFDSAGAAVVPSEGAGAAVVLSEGAGAGVDDAGAVLDDTGAVVEDREAVVESAPAAALPADMREPRKFPLEKRRTIANTIIKPFLISGSKLLFAPGVLSFAITFFLSVTARADFRAADALFGGYPI